MPGIAVEIVIDAPAAFVWSDVEDITSHVDWMQDAVGPFKLTDVMEITEWEDARRMGVRHQGIVGGTGVFSLTPSGSATVFSWVEELDFPWYLAGPLGASVARPVLKAIWRGNLRRLKKRIEAKWAEERTTR